MKSQAKAGFTLAEMMVASTIFGMMGLALASMTHMAFQGQSTTIGKNALSNNAALLGQALQSALASASYIQTPVPQTTLPSSDLITWDNTDPNDGSVSVVNGSINTRTFRQFCLQSGSTLYLYQGQYNGSWPMPGFPFPCDGAPHSGIAPVLVAGHVSGMAINISFTRPTNNVLQFSYSVQLAQPNQLPPDCSSQRWCFTQAGTVILNGAWN